MKKFLTPIAVTLLLASAGIVSAQDSTTTLPIKPRPVVQTLQNIKAERTDIKSAIKDVRVDTQEKMEDLRLDTKTKIRVATSSEVRVDLIKNTRVEAKRILEAKKATTTQMRLQLKALTRQHFGVTLNRYTIALKQFDNLATRIQSRIDKLKTGGVDVRAAESALTNARTAIEVARTDAKAVSDIVAAVVDTSDVRAVRREIAEAIGKANASIKTAHRSLGLAASTLAPLHRSLKSNATSTQSSN
ncbi:MAG TPA: hypothetical protein VJH69_03975 [Candidatus Paceibacterota bacterium]